MLPGHVAVALHTTSVYYQFVCNIVIAMICYVLLSQLSCEKKRDSVDPMNFLLS